MAFLCRFIAGAGSGSAAVGFAKIMVSPSSYERAEAKGPAVEIEVGSDILIRIPTTVATLLLI
jgi:hypothetical protein